MNNLTVFYYVIFYYFSVFMFTIDFFINEMSTIWYSLYQVNYILIFLGSLVLLSFMYESLYIKVFIAISSILNSILVLIMLISKNTILINV